MPRKKNYIKIFPRCGSRKIDHRGMISRKAYSNAYVCLSCGFQSPLFPEISEENAKTITTEQPQNFVQSRLPIFSDYARGFSFKKIFFVHFLGFWFFY